MAKVTSINAGNFELTLTLVRDILTFPRLAGTTICPMDIDPERLRFARMAVERRVAGGKYPARTETSRCDVTLLRAIHTWRLSNRLGPFANLANPPHAGHPALMPWPNSQPT